LSSPGHQGIFYTIPGGFKDNKELLKDMGGEELDP